MSNEAQFYSGTSGLVLPVPNKQFFPPEFQDKSRLNYYASLFNSLEINSSFYKVPMPATVQKWAADVPEDFQFTFKLWRDITHEKGLIFKREDVNRFVQIINQVGDKKGCLLIQFPPSLTINSIGQVELLITELLNADAERTWKIALEFRNRSWYHEEVYDLLERSSMGMVVHDMPASSTPELDITTDFVYLRFHGPAGDYKEGYTDDFLHEYAYYIKGWMEEGRTVYTYFNNTAGDAVKNLMTLNRFVNF